MSLVQPNTRLFLNSNAFCDVQNLKLHNMMSHFPGFVLPSVGVINIHPMIEPPFGIHHDILFDLERVKEQRGLLAML